MRIGLGGLAAETDLPREDNRPGADGWPKTSRVLEKRLTEDRSTIILYALSTCSACKAVKRQLEEAEVDFTAVGVDLLGAEEKRAAMTALKEKNPRGSYPTLVAEDTVIVGNQTEKIRKVLDLSQPQKDHPLVQWWNRVRGRSQS